MKDQQKYLKFVKDLALEAGQIMQRYYRLDHEVKVKLDASPVTIADTTINNLLIERVKQAFPDHGVLGEEASWQPERQVLWVCDPIDGTSAFIEHMPLSMFSLALVVNGVPQVAVAYNPWVGDLYHAAVGKGAYRNDQPITVSERGWGKWLRLAGSSSASTSPEPVDQPAIYTKLHQQGIHIVNPPGAVFKGCLIAEGSLDGRIFMHDGAHDIAALKLIIEEAGGKVTDLAGNEQRYDRPINGAIMSNGVIHNQLLELVQNHKAVT